MNIPKMIVGLFVANTQTNEITFRMSRNISTSKTEFIISDFMSTVNKDEGEIIRSLYKYTYNLVNATFYVAITSINYNKNKARMILDTIEKNSNTDIFDILVTIDNILYDQTLFTPNLSLIKSMDSQEEKLHDLIVKNKSKEVVQKQKEMERKKVSEIDKQLAKVKALEMEVRNESIQQLKKVTKMVADPVKEKRQELDISSEAVFIVLKEKLKITVDKENEVKNTEINGDLSVTINEEEYKNVEIRLKNTTKNMKFSPNLNKAMSSKGIIKSDKGFPIGRGLALVKWKSTEKYTPPIAFTYWPSEISLNTYQIIFEYTTEKPLKNLSIFIPKESISNTAIPSTATETDSHIEWNVGDVEEGASDTLEFTCTCTDPSEIFPIDVYFTLNYVSTNLGIDKVLLNDEEVAEIEIKKVFEVDKFTIVDE